MQLGKIPAVGSRPQRPTSSGSGSGSDSPDSPSTERGTSSTGANGGILLEEATEITGSTNRRLTSPAAYGGVLGNKTTTGPFHPPCELQFPASTYVSQATSSSSVDVKQIKDKVTKAAVDFLNSVLKSLRLEEVIHIRFDTGLTIQKTCRMYVDLPENGRLIHVLRKILNKEGATHFDYEVDFKESKPEQQVLKEMLCDLLVTRTLDILISIKEDEVSRNTWGKYSGGSISIGPRNKIFSDQSQNSDLPLNIVFRWNSPDDFIDKYQSGKMVSMLSAVEGLDDLSDSLPQILTQNLSLLGK